MSELILNVLGGLYLVVIGVWVWSVLNPKEEKDVAREVFIEASESAMDFMIDNANKKKAGE